MKKESLRNVFLSKRLGISDRQRKKYDENIFLALKHALQLHKPYYHIYLGNTEKGEINTHDWILQNNFLEKNILIPGYSLNDSKMRHYHFDEALVLKKNRFGFFQVIKGNEFQGEKKITLIIVPLLCFDLMGHRVGYGWGFYDQMMANYPQAKKLGLSYFAPVDKIDDINKNDIPLNGVITPQQTYNFPVL